VFCERCGRLLNRATGKCVCDGDPSLAAPVAAASSSAVNSTVLLAPAAPPATEKELADAAVAARQVRQLDGRPPESRAGEAPAAYVATGRVRCVLGGLRAGRARVDLRIHDDALVVVRANGDEAVVPVSQVVAVTLSPTPRGGTVHIGAGRVGNHTLRFSKRAHSVTDVAGQLQAVATRRFSLVPMARGAEVAHRAVKVAAALVVVAMVGVGVKALVFPSPKTGDDLPAVARESLREACPSWRVAPMHGPALAAAAAPLRAAFERAATASEFASLGADIALVIDFGPKAGSPTVPLSEAAAFSGAVDRIDAACARAGA
jgi:hypothetical protein